METELGPDKHDFAQLYTSLSDSLRNKWSLHRTERYSLDFLDMQSCLVTDADLLGHLALCLSTVHSEPSTFQWSRWKNDYEYRRLEKMRVDLQEKIARIIQNNPGSMDPFIAGVPSPYCLVCRVIAWVISRIQVEDQLLGLFILSFIQGFFVRRDFFKVRKNHQRYSSLIICNDIKWTIGKFSIKLSSFVSRSGMLGLAGFQGLKFLIINLC